MSCILNKLIQFLITVFVISFSLSAFWVPHVKVAEDFWITKEPMPTARSGLGVAVVNGKIYAIGGSDGNGHLNTTEEYDPATNTWATKKPMPTARQRFGIAVYQNKIYVIGGSTHSGFTGTNEVYNPLTDTWETKTSMPAGGRSELAASVVNGKIYLISGHFLGVYWIPSNLTEVYDPETDTWTTKASMPTAVYGSTSAVVNNKIYVIENSYSGEIQNLGLNQIYDAETDTWSYGQPLPVRAAEAIAAATSGVYAPKRIYVIGGGDVFSYSLIQIYNAETDSWSNGTSMLTPRQSLGVAALNDTLYAIGGYTVENWEDDPVYTGANEQYTPSEYIPEFPSWIILPLLLITIAVAILYRKNRIRTINRELPYSSTKL